MIPRLVWREIRNQKRFSLIFILNVSLGLAGLMSLENFRLTFESALQSRSRSLLGADLALSSRTPISQAKAEEALESVRAESEYQMRPLVSLFSMAKAGAHTRLVSVRSLPPGYPYYGQLKFKSGESYPSEAIQLDSHTVWVYPELLYQLKVGLGDKIQIGTKDFTITRLVIEDSQQSFQMGGIAPRVFMSQEAIEKAGLIAKGTTARYSYAIKSVRAFSEDELELINKRLDDHRIRVSTPDKASEQVGRVMAYLSDFLGLVSLVALFLAFVGIFYLYRSHLMGLRLNMAILSSLGLGRSRRRLYHLCHLFFLSVAGSILGVLLGLFLSRIGLEIMSRFMTFEIDALVTGRAILMGLAVGIVGVFLLAIPLIESSLRERPQSLFQEFSLPKADGKGLKLLSYLPLYLFFFGLSLYSAHSVKVGSLFVGALTILALGLYPLGSWLLKFLGGHHFKKLEVGLSVRYLSRYRTATLSILMALFFGSLLLNLIPQLQFNIRQEIDGPRGAGMPSLFMFDIQDEQVIPIRRFFQRKNLALLGLSPMVRARLEAINEQAFVVKDGEALTREEEREQRFRNRGINLSFRAELGQGERLVEGRPFSAQYDSESGRPAEISVEKRYAQRLGIELGDVLTFNILGVPIEGKVVNLRTVRWTTFLPNFFLLFQPGVLEDAPKTWLGAVANLSFEDKQELQNQLFDQFPNVSVVDIGRVVERIRKILDQMGLAMQAMSLMSLVVGLLVLYSLAGHQMNTRKRDVVLLKLMGMKLGRLRSMILVEFVSMGLLASAFGALLALLISYLFSLLLFEGLWTFVWYLPLATVTMVTLLCGLVAWPVVSRTLKTSPRVLLG